MGRIICAQAQVNGVVGKGNAGAGKIATEGTGEALIDLNQVTHVGSGTGTRTGERNPHPIGHGTLRGAKFGRSPGAIQEELALVAAGRAGFQQDPQGGGNHPAITAAVEIHSAPGIAGGTRHIINDSIANHHIPGSQAGATNENGPVGGINRTDRAAGGGGDHGRVKSKGIGGGRLDGKQNAGNKDQTEPNG